MKTKTRTKPNRLTLVIANLIISLIVNASVLVLGGPLWAAVGFGWIAYLICVER